MTVNAPTTIVLALNMTAFAPNMTIFAQHIYRLPSVKIMIVFGQEKHDLLKIRMQILCHPKTTVFVQYLFLFASKYNCLCQ